MSGAIPPKKETRPIRGGAPWGGGKAEPRRISGMNTGDFRRVGIKKQPRKVSRRPQCRPMPGAAA